uniref:prepilin-type N-terminal cleavage/methylation domain-containing protein n=1 Tax=Candidatus Scatousia sp. TaxID=3085663 RepID=UPI00402818C9
MVLRGGGRLSFLSGQGFTGGSDRENGYPELVSGSCLAKALQAVTVPRPLRERVMVRGKSAFTLAEVLITLGIIGIVAAMTMPTLIGKYKKKELANRAKVAYSILSQAIKLSEVENGEVKYWDAYPGGGHGFENTR